MTLNFNTTSLHIIDFSFSRDLFLSRIMGEIQPVVLNGTAKAPKTILWTHPDPSSTHMAAFMQEVNRKYGVDLTSYDNLYRWSINNIAEFWGEVWDFTEVTASKPYDEVSETLLYLTWWYSGLRSRSLLIAFAGHSKKCTVIPSAGFLCWVSSQLCREFIVPKKSHDRRKVSRNHGSY